MTFMCNHSLSVHIILQGQTQVGNSFHIPNSVSPYPARSVQFNIPNMKAIPEATFLKVQMDQWEVNYSIFYSIQIQNTTILTCNWHKMMSNFTFFFIS